MYSGDDEELNGFNEQMGELIKPGIVSSVDPATCSARVIFPDRDEMVSADLPILQRNCGKNQDFSLPDVGDNVLCLFLGTGTEDGFILGSFFNEKKKSTLNDPNVRGVIFSDGTRVVYDREKKLLNIEAAGKISVKTKEEISVISEKNIFAESKENIFAKASKGVEVKAAQTLDLTSNIKVNINAPAIALNAASISFGDPTGKGCSGICPGAFNLKSESNMSFKAKRIDLG